MEFTIFTALRIAGYPAPAFTATSGVDVADDDVAGIAPLEFADRLDRAAFNQTAAGVFIRHDHDSRRIQDLRCFRHKPDTAKGDDIAFSLARTVSKFQTVADHVGKFLNANTS